MKALRTAAVIAASVSILMKASLGADDQTTKVPSPDLLSRLRYKSLWLGGAEVRLGMSSNDVTTAFAKANLHGMWMIADPHTPSVRQYNVAGTNSLGHFEPKGIVFFREGVAICINRTVASFRDDDRGTDFARRLVELLWTVETEEGTERILSRSSVIRETFDSNRRLVSTVGFSNAMTVLPIQAADLLAYRMRQALSNQLHREKPFSVGKLEEELGAKGRLLVQYYADGPLKELVARHNPH
jgi:hypothetical protein